MRSGPEPERRWPPPLLLLRDSFQSQEAEFTLKLTCWTSVMRVRIQDAATRVWGRGAAAVFTLEAL